MDQAGKLVCEATSLRRHCPDQVQRVAIRAVAGADDRFIPVGFQRALARERVGVEADVLPGGHLMALSQPAPLAGYLLAVR